MKKIFTFAIVLAAATLMSCGTNANTAVETVETETIEATCEPTDSCGTCDKADTCAAAEVVTEVVAQ